MIDPPHEATESELLQTLLASRDIPCPVCGYNLRTIASADCPECGSHLDLRIGSTDLKLGPWLTAIISFALAMGFVSIYTLLSVPMIFTGMGGVYLLFVAIPALLTIGYAVLLWRLIRTRKKFWAKSRRAQRISALVCVFVGPGLIVLVPLLLMLVA